MTNLSRCASVILVALALVGCATVGHDFEPARANELKVGESTIADAEALLGEPYSTTVLGTGDTMYMWMHVASSAVPLPFYTAMNTRSKSVMLTFGPDGKLKPRFGAPAAPSRDFDPSLATILKPGVSTQEDAKRLFGEPTVTSVQAGGKVLCVWSRAAMSNEGTINSKSVTLTFGADGILQDPATTHYSAPTTAAQQ